MVNQEQPKTPWNYEALLAEYSVLQSGINSNGSSYWILASIFISIGSALLLGSVFGVITNDHLYQMWLGQLQRKPSEMQRLQVVIIVIGIFVVLMLSLVRLWLRRVKFLQQIDFERMRDIERQLGMWKIWRVHGVDHWNVKACDFDSEISDKDRLINYQPQDWWCNWRVGGKYARPSGWHYDGIFAVLIFLWLFLVFSISVPLSFPLSLVGFVIAGGATWLVIHLTRVH